MILNPINKRIIMEKPERLKKTNGGIIIPEVANQKATTHAKVLAIAKDSIIKYDIKVGDTVLFSKFSGTEITFGSKESSELIIMKDEDVLAVIKN